MHVTDNVERYAFLFDIIYLTTKADGLCLVMLYFVTNVSRFMTFFLFFLAPCKFYVFHIAMLYYLAVI